MLPLPLALPKPRALYLIIPAASGRLKHDTVIDCRSPGFYPDAFARRLRVSA